MPNYSIFGLIVKPFKSHFISLINLKKMNLLAKNQYEPHRNHFDFMISNLKSNKIINALFYA